MKKKWSLHIIAVVFITVFLMACMSAPRVPDPQEIIFDQNIPENQTAILFVHAGTWEVTHFNNEQLRPAWFQALATRGGMNVRIPAGLHTVTFNYHGGQHGGGTIRGMNISFNAVAGRNYRFWAQVIEGTSYQRGQVITSIFEASQTRMPGPNEQLFILTLDRRSELIVYDISLQNTATGEIRNFRSGIRMDHRGRFYDTEIRIIIPRGTEHQISFSRRPRDGGSIVPADGTVLNYSASTEPVRLRFLSRSVRGIGNFSYTLTRE